MESQDHKHRQDSQKLNVRVSYAAPYYDALADYITLRIPISAYVNQAGMHVMVTLKAVMTNLDLNKLYARELMGVLPWSADKYDVSFSFVSEYKVYEELFEETPYTIRDYYDVAHFSWIGEIDGSIGEYLWTEYSPHKDFAAALDPELKGTYYFKTGPTRCNEYKGKFVTPISFCFENDDYFYAQEWFIVARRR